MGIVDHGPFSEGNRESSVTITRVFAPGAAPKSAARVRRIAWPSAAHDSGKGSSAMPPPVTNSWTRIVRTPGTLMVGSVFRIIPVIDVLRGQAVHAVGGERSRYQPLRSILHPSHDPLELARACRDALGLSSLYLADLDAIISGEPNRSLYRSLESLGLDLWLDAGLRDERDLSPLLDLNRTSILAGLESLRGPDALSAMLNRAGPDRLIVSLDLWEGRPITASPDAWPEIDPIALANRIIGLGVRRMLLLDLTRVGKGTGPGTEALLSSIRAANPGIEIAARGRGGRSDGRRTVPLAWRGRRFSRLGPARRSHRRRAVG